MTSPVSGRDRLSTTNLQSGGESAVGVERQSALLMAKLRTGSDPKVMILLLLVTTFILRTLAPAGRWAEATLASQQIKRTAAMWAVTLGVQGRPRGTLSASTLPAVGRLWTTAGSHHYKTCL